jgi:RNA polymerase sigma factor (sigma-70 family)
MDGEKKLIDEISQNMDLLAKKINILVRYKYLDYSDKKIEEISNEVLSMTLEAAILSAGKYDPKKEAVPWLMGIANNKLKDYMRKLFSESKKVEFIEDYLSFSDDCFDFDEKLFYLSRFATETHHDIEKLLFDFVDIISILSKKEQRLLSYLYEKKYSYADIAEKFNSSKDAIYTQKYRLISKLKRYYGNN